MSRERRVWLLLALLLAAGLACTKATRIVYLEDEVPLAAPLEGDPDRGGGYAADEREDPPSRVARVSYLNGPVSVQPGGVDDWAPAQLNLPLKGGDALWAPSGSRAELQVGPTGLRASDGTSLELLRVEDGAFQVGLDQGAVMVRLLPGAARDAVEVDTPAGAVTLGSAGTYRVDMAADRPDASVTVRTGHADVTLEGEVIPVGPGKRLRITGGDEPSFELENAPPPDEFERWSEGREAREANSLGAQKLGRAFTGAGDLDGAGTWKTHPDYGDVWTPNVPAGWAPYRNGRWAWVDPWGWTWVDDAPWGFTTSHYGRWTALNGTWSWVPRASATASGRPVYAPALVGFVGEPEGPRRDKPISGGGVAWFPLGPKDPYAPAYPVSRTYYSRMNPWVKDGKLPKAGAWGNQSVPGAVTVVPRSTFTSFAPVAKAVVPMGDPRFFQSARVGAAPALPPTARSVLAGSSQPASRPPGELGGRPWLARTPLPPRPVPFNTRQNALKASMGRPLGFSGLNALRRQGPFLEPNRAWHGATMRNAPAPLRNRAAEAAASRLGPVPARREGTASGPTRNVQPWELNRPGQRQGRDQPLAKPAANRAAPNRERAAPRAGTARVNPQGPGPRPGPAPRAGGNRVEGKAGPRGGAAPKGGGARGGGRKK